jgi:hypothetical protein
MESEGEHFLAYYLMKDDDEIPTLQDQRIAGKTGTEEPESVRNERITIIIPFSNVCPEYCVSVHS